MTSCPCGHSLTYDAVLHDPTKPACCFPPPPEPFAPITSALEHARSIIAPFPLHEEQALDAVITEIELAVEIMEHGPA